MLHKQIQSDIQDALRSKDEVLLTTLRSLLSSLTNELVSKKRKPSEELSDEDVLIVLARAAKQRRDSIKEFKKGERNDLAEREEKELAIIESFLPIMMDEEEVRKVVVRKKSELGINESEKKGLLIGAVMKELKGKADGMTVKNVVDSLF